MGGKVESLENGGSAFRVFLPGRRAAAEAAAAPAPTSATRRRWTPPRTPWRPRWPRSPTADVPIVVGAQTEDAPTRPGASRPSRLLVQELHRLSEITAED